MQRSTFTACMMFLLMFLSLYPIYDTKDSYLFYHSFFSSAILPQFILAMNIIKERRIIEAYQDRDRLGRYHKFVNIISWLLISIGWYNIYLSKEYNHASNFYFRKVVFSYHNKIFDRA
jgi:hypothetical protein